MAFYETVSETTANASIGDLNGDGKPEIIVGYVNAPGMAYFNDGAGRRYKPTPLGDGKGAIYGFAVGDLNEDGYRTLWRHGRMHRAWCLFSTPGK